MTNDIVVIPKMPMANMQDACALAMAFAQAHVMGAQNPAEGMMAVVLINEIGIVRAEARYHIMMGRLSKKAEAILSDFVRAGGTYRIVKRDSDCAEVVASMGETKDATFRFAWTDALLEPFVYAGKPSEQRAEMKKPLDKRAFKDKYATPRSRMQMLWARLVSDMGRALCPDACEGLYPPEEVADFDDAHVTRAGEPLSDAEAARRAKNVTGAEETIVDDCLVCPIGGEGYEGRAWGEFGDDVLTAALASDDPALRPGHKAAIRLVMQERKGAKT